MNNKKDNTRRKLSGRNFIENMSRNKIQFKSYLNIKHKIQMSGSMQYACMKFTGNTPQNFLIKTFTVAFYTIFYIFYNFRQSNIYVSDAKNLSHQL